MRHRMLRRVGMLFMLMVFIFLFVFSFLSAFLV